MQVVRIICFLLLGFSAFADESSIEKRTAALAQERLETLIEVARDVQLEINQSEVGRVEEVLVERPAREPGQVLGRTRRNKVVAFEGEASWLGTYRRVRLTSTSGATFAGRQVEEPRTAELA